MGGISGKGEGGLTVIPTTSPIQCTWVKDDQAYMKIPIGRKMAAAHAPYRRASGPRLGKCLLMKARSEGDAHLRRKTHLLVQFLLIKIGNKP